MVICMALAVAAAAHGQSYNIDFGDSGDSPSSSHSAAGLAGTWNSIGVPTPGVFYPLVDVAGVDAGVTLNNFGGTQLLIEDDPATFGDDDALMDDMLIGFNDPVDVCIWINDIPNGEYEVLIYALTPNDPDLFHRTRVDFADQRPIWIGGAWPGQHQLDVTYSRFTVNVFNNEIGLHSGVFGGNIESGINGIQIRPLVQGDLTGDGEVGPADLAQLLAAWGRCNGSCLADFTGDGQVGPADLAELLANWG
jgi:hypothetical protein